MTTSQAVRQSRRHARVSVRRAGPALRAALLGMLSLGLGQEVLAQITIVQKELPSVDDADNSPIALDLLPGLVDNGGFAAIRGFYAASGVRFADPGTLRAFHVIPPLPSPIDSTTGLGLLVSFETPLVELPTNRRKKYGIHGVRMARMGMGVVSTPIEYIPNGTGLGTFVSLFDPLQQTYKGEINTPVVAPDPMDNGGRVSEGTEFFSTLANGRNRFIAVNNYHEGSLTLIDWTDSASVEAFAEYRLNELPTDYCDPAPYPHPEGNHNRAIAVAIPTAGNLAHKTLLLVTLNYDPFGNDCTQKIDDLFGDPRPDDGATDYLVILDVTGLDPDMAVPPLASLFPDNLSTGLVPLGPSIQGTLTAVCVSPDQNVAYVVSKNQIKGNSLNEKPHLYTVDLTISPPSVIFSQAIETLDSSLTGFQAATGHIVAIRNENLLSVAKDRLYIGSQQFPGVPDSGVLVLDIKNTPLNPTFLSFAALPDDPTLNTTWQVSDLVASPVKSDFLGPDLARNVIFGILRNAHQLASSPIKGRLLFLEDR